MRPIYLDCNATTPLDPEVLEVLTESFSNNIGNEGSRTHEYGTRAKKSVQHARDLVASCVSAKRDEVIFTSGATESNNLALLGLLDFGKAQEKRHIITSSIEHKSVLEPCDFLQKNGFEISYIPVGENGVLNLDILQNKLREDTLLVSVMQANNETGILQPLESISQILSGHPAYFHTDAAQGFGKDLSSLTNPRIDLISISGHKIYAPKGVGALITRRRGYDRPPLRALFYGGGQEKGLRPGTLPVPLIAALGKAAEIAVRDNEKRSSICQSIREKALSVLQPLGAKLTGDQGLAMDHVLNLSLEGLNSEALMIATKDIISISNGSACTSASYNPSHVLKAMGMSDDEANECVRISWCHMTPEVDWEEVGERIKQLL